MYLSVYIIVSDDLNARVGEIDMALFTPFHQYLPQPAITPPLITAIQRFKRGLYKPLTN